MLRTILSRLLQGVIVIFLLFTVTFFAVRLIPGNPFTAEKEISEAAIEQKKKEFYLDKALPVQYVLMGRDLLKGDFKNSTQYERPVIEIIQHSFPASLLLGLTATLIAIFFGIPAGIIAALRQNSLIDYGSMSIAMLGISIPSFVMAPIVASNVPLLFPGLKVAGWGDPLDWILPAFVLSLGTAAYLARITRSGMLDILSQDYIRTAKAKGLKESMIVIKHALRGGIMPAVAYIGPAFAALITGSFIIETIFQIPGMGQHFVNATKERDYMLLQGIVIFFGVLIVVVNLLADIALVILNPRMKDA